MGRFSLADASGICCVWGGTPGSGSAGIVALVVTAVIVGVVVDCSCSCSCIVPVVASVQARDSYIWSFGSLALFARSRTSIVERSRAVARSLGRSPLLLYTPEYFVAKTTTIQ